MTQNDVQFAVREAMWMILKLSMPFLLISIVLGLIVAIFQAATQIHEQTITFVPKIIAISLLVVFLGPWLLTSLTDFFKSLIEIMARL